MLEMLCRICRPPMCVNKVGLILLVFKDEARNGKDDQKRPRRGLAKVKSSIISSIFHILYLKDAPSAAPWWRSEPLLLTPALTACGFVDTAH